MEVINIRLMHEVQELLTRWATRSNPDEEHLTPSRCFILARAAMNKPPNGFRVTGPDSPALAMRVAKMRLWANAAPTSLVPMHQ